MRQEWEPEDLIEVWTLLEDDMAKLRNKSGANRGPAPGAAPVRQPRQHALRAGEMRLVNSTFTARDEQWWGAGTACASDSKKFGSWSSNFMPEWHQRYRGPGVVVYWHVERKSVCVYSQLKSCSASEVAAMIEGVLRHCTEMVVDRQYTDTHGASIVGFAFAHMLGFNLLPRLKNVGSARLYRPATREDESRPQLGPVLSKKTIDWELIRQQYDQIVKYRPAPGHRGGRAGPAALHPRRPQTPHLPGH